MTAPSGPQGAAMAERGGRKRILLVDDSPTALLMETALLVDDYEIVTARDGQEAVAKALEDRPDLIVLDIMMPRLSGLDACRQLRQDERTRDTPIILATTRSEMEAMEAGYENGCSDYVIKPIDRAELHLKIRNLLGI